VGVFKAFISKTARRQVAHRAKQLKTIEKEFKICLEMELKPCQALLRNHPRKNQAEDMEAKKAEA
jgi:hypothetical protein